MCRQGERARAIDLFGVPVGVTYNKKPVFKTGLGGIVTIVLLIYFTSHFFLSMI